MNLESLLKILIFLISQYWKVFVFVILAYLIINKLFEKYLKSHGLGKVYLKWIKIKEVFFKVFLWLLLFVVVWFLAYFFENQYGVISNYTTFLLFLFIFLLIQVEQIGAKIHNIDKFGFKKRKFFSASNFTIQISPNWFEILKEVGIIDNKEEFSKIVSRVEEEKEYNIYKDGINLLFLEYRRGNYFIYWEDRNEFIKGGEFKFELPQINPEIDKSYPKSPGYGPSQKYNFKISRDFKIDDKQVNSNIFRIILDKLGLKNYIGSLNDEDLIEPKDRGMFIKFSILTPKIERKSIENREENTYKELVSIPEEFLELPYKYRPAHFLDLFYDKRLEAKRIIFKNKAERENFELFRYKEGEGLKIDTVNQFKERSSYYRRFGASPPVRLKHKFLNISKTK